jgi:hypothetical protein
VILAPYQLNHVRLEVWRRLDAKRQRGEAIQTSDQFDLFAQVESEGVMGNSYEGTIRTESGCFRLAFIGAELQRLKSEGVPFIYW